MQRSIRRLLSLVAVMTLVVAACADPDIAPAGTGAPLTASTTSTISASGVQPAVSTTASSDDPLDGRPSALREIAHPDFPAPLVDTSQIISGGPPPDGIPPIDNPSFVTVAEADAYMDDAEPVVFIDIDGDVRAYPVAVMIWHEIVNDTVGGVPVSITYCPLCNSAVSYRREVLGVETTFGTSGMLFNSALVMYDRATESLWTHFDGRAVVGSLTGEVLEPIGSPLLAWSDFKAIYPEGEVLDRDGTGYSRSYGTNPYVGYDDPDGVPFLFRGDADDRARKLQRVVGIAVGEESLAYSLDAIITDGGLSVTPVTLGDQDLVILWAGGQGTALEARTIGEGRDVGSVGVFVPEADGMVITLTPLGDGFSDDLTGSTWTVTGLAVDGPLAGAQLERIPHLDTFWFAWSTYRPGTLLIEEQPGG